MVKWQLYDGAGSNRPNCLPLPIQKYIDTIECTQYMYLNFGLRNIYISMYRNSFCIEMNKEKQTKEFFSMR